jgi:hypothetical protein
VVRVGRGFLGLDEFHWGRVMRDGVCKTYVA